MWLLFRVSFRDSLGFHLGGVVFGFFRVSHKSTHVDIGGDQIKQVS